MKNPKLMDLAAELLRQVQAKFPDVAFIRYRDNPESENSVLIEVTAPASDERELALMDFVSELETNILLEHGFMIFVLPQRNGATLAPTHDAQQ